MRNQPITSATSSDLGQIVAAHGRMMYRVAHALLRHPEDAEDAVQDALLKLHRSGAFGALANRDIADEKAYLARTVWRAAFDRLGARPTQAADEHAALRLEDPRATPEEAASRGDAHALLHQMIDRLPEELRQPLLLSAIEELNSREIAAAIGIPEGTVRTRLMRARAVLRNHYAALNPPTRQRETAVAER